MNQRRSSKKTPSREGKIITFYSYKGGSARSLTVANTAWVLASNKKRVLIIDWDLEAPGLHRYFHPFIEDSDLKNTPGLIDFLIEMVEGSRLTHDPQQPNEAWFRKYTNLRRYAFTLDWEFPKGGTIDFVPAGQQNAGYAVRVMTFDWQNFYERLRGGIFLEAVKQRLRSEYDYVLIDSRTGISDASGICTVQMPDSLVVCFTFNNQSILGAAAVADSAFSQRKKPSGEPGLKIWPVPTRVEIAEKERLEMARTVAQYVFQKYLKHMPRAQRKRYWQSIEIPYDPYFAYEEVLAPFAESHRTKLSVMESVFSLARYITDNDIKTFAVVPEHLRREILPKFSRASELIRTDNWLARRYIYVSCPNEDRPYGEALARQLQKEIFDASFRWNGSEAVQEANSEPFDSKLFQKAAAVIILITPSWISGLSEWYISTVHMALEARVPIILAMPVEIRYEQLSDLPLFKSLIREHAVIFSTFSTESRSSSYKNLVRSLRDLLLEMPSSIDPDDPQKGQWGGKASRNGRALTAKVAKMTSDWFQINLEVKKISGASLKGDVEFHLHPTFVPSVRKVTVAKGRALLTLHAWGAFTLGALADDGATELELNLATLRNAPQTFRAR